MENVENKTGDYWYLHHQELEPEQVFRTEQGNIVKLDRGVPGDGTKWYVATWHNGWFYEDNTIEPGDLCGDPIEPGHEHLFDQPAGTASFGF